MRDTIRIALVTGGHHGLGLATAREIGKTGVKVILGASDLIEGDWAARALLEEGVAAEAIRLDSRDQPSIDDAFRFFDKHYGKLDILVNCAALRPVTSTPSLGTATDAHALRISFDSDLAGLVALTEALLPLIIKAPAGRIVNVSSQPSSLVTHTATGAPIEAVDVFAYNAARNSLHDFTVRLAKRLAGTRVKVNSAHPGWIKTEVTHAVDPRDIANGGMSGARLALLSEDGPTGGFFDLGEPLPW